MVVTFKKRSDCKFRCMLSKKLREIVSLSNQKIHEKVLTCKLLHFRLTFNIKCGVLVIWLLMDSAFPFARHMNLFLVVFHNPQFIKPWDIKHWRRLYDENLRTSVSTKTGSLLYILHCKPFSIPLWSDSIHVTSEVSFFPTPLQRGLTLICFIIQQECWRTAVNFQQLVLAIIVIKMTINNISMLKMRSLLYSVMEGRASKEFTCEFLLN